MKIKILSVAVMAVALAVSLRPATAAGMPVYDSVHTIQNVYTQLYNGSLSTAEFGKQAMRWAQQNQHNLAQIEHMARQLVSAQRFVNFRGNELPTLAERDPNEGVAEQCPGSGQGVAGYLASVVKVRADVDLAEQQKMICRQIAIARNLQFNNSVRLLQRLRSRGQQMEEIERARNAVGNRMGDLSTNSNDVERFLAATGNDMNEWQSTNDSYERYVQLLRGYSTGIARQALQGKNRVIGSAVQALALKMALENARR